MLYLVGTPPDKSYVSPLIITELSFKGLGDIFKEY